MGWGEDFSEVVSNPAFLLGAAGALAPEEVNIGGTWWRLAPRLRGLSQVMGAARGSVDERKAAEGMAGLAQGIGQGTGGSQLPWPPVAPQEGAPAGPESAPTATSRAPLPPGMARAALVQQMTPEMFRGLRNRAQIAGLDTIMGAAEAQAKDYETAAKKKAIYDAMRLGLSKTYPPEVAEVMARSAAENLQAPDQAFLTTPLAEREAKVNAAQMALRKTQEEQGFLNEASQIDPNNFEQVKAFQATAREKYPTISFERIFSGNPSAAYKFHLQEVASINEQYAAKGMLVYPKLSADGKVALEPQPYRGDAPEDIQRAAHADLALVDYMVKNKLLPKDVGGSAALALRGAAETGNAEAFKTAHNNIQAMWRTHLLALESRNANMNLLKQQDYLRAMTILEQKRKVIEDRLKGQAYHSIVSGPNPAQTMQRASQAMLENYQKDVLMLKQIDATISRMMASPDSAGFRQVLGIASEEAMKYESGTEKAVNEELRRRRALPPK